MDLESDSAVAARERVLFAPVKSTDNSCQRVSVLKLQKKNSNRQISFTSLDSSFRDEVFFLIYCTCCTFWLIFDRNQKWNEWIGCGFVFN